MNGSETPELQLSTFPLNGRTPPDMAISKPMKTALRSAQGQKKQPTVTKFWRFNGVGTAVLGKRDFQPDGTYITTAWFTLFWIPLIPLESYRILPQEGSSFSIQEVFPIHRRQALFTYTFSALYILLLVLAVLDLDKTNRVGILYFSLVPAALIPVAMRRYARRKLRLES